MSGGGWLSLGLGISLGAAYVAASLLLAGVAARRPVQESVLISLAGMLGRLLLALVLLIMALAFLPLQETVFVWSFLGAFVVGLIVEVALVHRRYGG